MLDPGVLTIGLARRFATYKRMNLFLADPERFIRILTDPERPIQFIIAGKSHPQDNQGKELIRSIIHFIREHDTHNHVTFIEDYDINVARYMVQGADCWLNVPRRPMEASGTSGMKAAANGALNISIPDGWWPEAEHLGEHGWSIGHGETYDSAVEQDLAESQMLYEILEHDVVPAFYERGRDGLPREWVDRMKTSIEKCSAYFNTHRMVQEYADRFYLPCTARRESLRTNNRAGSKALTEWKRRVRSKWAGVHFASVNSGKIDRLQFGAHLEVTAELELGELTPEDVLVEAYYGEVDRYDHIDQGVAMPLDSDGNVEGGLYRFRGSIPCEHTGRQGFAVRVIPRHADLAEKHEMRSVVWA